MRVVAVAAILWLVVLTQVLITRFWVSKHNFAEAFARNPVFSVSDEKTDQYGNRYVQGVCEGELEETEKRRLAEEFMNRLGGTVIFDTKNYIGENSYVAYGYTNGISKVKKINGTSINLTVTIHYDKASNQSTIQIGNPLINEDF